MNIPAPILRYLTASWRYRWFGFALAWLVCIPGWIVVYTMPNQYQSSARLYAEADVILGQALRGIAVDGAPQQQVELLARTLLSRPNIERVIARTDLDQRVTDVASREELVEKLGKEIRIGAQTRNLYQITYSDTNPRVAQAVVRTLIDLFMERAANNDRQQMLTARTFINQQIAAYETQLRDAERRRAEFRTRYLELLPNDALGGVSRLQAARARLADLNGALEDARLRRDVLKAQLDAIPVQTVPAAAAGGGGGGGNARVAEAERELREMRLRFTDQHPAVVAQRNMINELRTSGGGDPVRPAPRADGTVRPPAQIANPTRDALQTRIVEADLALASLERQVRSETADVERLEALARGAPQLMVEFNNLDRDYTVLTRQHAELLGRRESLQISGAARTGADQVRLEIVEPPTAPMNPTGPNRLLFASMVLLAGIGAGGAVAVLLGILDRSFYTLRDLRDIGLPVLGAVSAVNPPRQTVPAMVFAGGMVMLAGTYGLFLAQGTRMVAKGAEIMARMVT